MKKIMKYIRTHWQVVLTTAYTAVLFAVYIVAAAKGLPHLLRFGVLFLTILIAGVVFINFVTKRFSVNAGEVKDRNVLSKVAFDAIDRMDSPALMCRVDGKVFWCNEALRDAIGDGKKPYGKSVADVLGVSHERVRNAPVEDGLALEFGGRYYIAKYNPLKFDRGGGLIVLTESSELKTMGDELELVHEKLEDTSPVIAYILIDNLTEMVQYDSDSYRPATAKIDEVLREWASDAKGIIKEFERDRYVFIFEKKQLNRYIERKFDILDRIRDIRVGAEQLSVTVSVGVSAIYGTFAERDHAARAALELALSRGGDQVVLKTDDSTDFYGGRTKASGRRNSVRSRVVSNELIMHISRSSNVLIMGHKFPDFDCIGAAVGLARIAMFCGVDVNIVTNMKDENVALCMKSLEMLPEYRGVFVSADDGLDLMQTGTFVILADVNNMAIVEDSAIVEAADRYAVIDHHRKTAEFKKDPVLEYIEPKASSVSELVSEMLEIILHRQMLTPQEANLLLAGITLDTRQFTRMPGSRTYGAALYLHDSGAVPQSVQEFFKSEIGDYKKEARFRSNVVIYRNELAITICEESEGNGAGDKIIAAKAAEGLIGVRGIKAAFAIATVGDTMHISARSAGEVNVQLILERLRGGGHFDTAGAQIKGVTPEEAVRQLKGAIDDYFEQTRLENIKDGKKTADK